MHLETETVAKDECSDQAECAQHHGNAHFPRKKDGQWVGKVKTYYAWTQQQLYQEGRERLRAKHGVTLLYLFSGDAVYITKKIDIGQIQYVLKIIFVSPESTKNLILNETKKTFFRVLAKFIVNWLRLQRFLKRKFRILWILCCRWIDFFITRLPHHENIYFPTFCSLKTICTITEEAAPTSRCLHVFMFWARSQFTAHGWAKSRHFCRNCRSFLDTTSLTSSAIRTDGLFRAEERSY